MEKSEPDIQIIHRANSAKKQLVRVSKMLKETGEKDDSGFSQTMKSVSNLIEWSSNNIEIEEIVKEVYSNPEWFKFYYESEKMKETISVNKCCNKKEKFLVTYDMGYGDEEKWLVCEEHDKDEPFQENILEKKLV